MLIILEIREMVSFQLGKEIEKDVFSSFQERGTKKKRKNSEYQDQQCRKFTISLISIYKHYAFDIADPSGIQDACHMNVVIDLAHRGVYVAQWLEYWSAESEGLRFVFSWGLRIFSLSHVRDKTKNKLFCYSALRTFFLNIIGKNFYKRL